MVCASATDCSSHVKMDTFNDPWPSPPVLDGLSSDQMDSLAELHEGAFEPQIRARSNTWPLPRPENFVEPNDDTDNNQQSSNQQSLTGKSWSTSMVNWSLMQEIVCDVSRFAKP